MCADLRIETENGLVYVVHHEPDGCHLTCSSERVPGNLIDQPIHGFTYPFVGRPMTIFADRPLATPPVVAVTAA